MEPQLRIRICRLAERMKENKRYAEVLKLEDVSYMKKENKIL